MDEKTLARPVSPERERFADRPARSPERGRR